MPQVYLSAFGGVGAQFFDNSGNVLTGGLIYSYLAGSTTPAPVYTTSAGNVAHSNPIVLDAAGRVPSGGEIWQPAGINYKFELKTSSGVTLSTLDNVGTIATGSATIQNFTGTGSQTNFTLSFAPINENATNVFINGVYQQKNTYSLSSTTLTFSEAPPVTSTIEVNFF